MREGEVQAWHDVKVEQVTRWRQLTIMVVKVPASRVKELPQEVGMLLLHLRAKADPQDARFSQRPSDYFEVSLRLVTSS